jgi:uncharacterized protein (TIGR02596 family)
MSIRSERGLRVNVRTGHHPTEGFSLLELLAVIAVIAILAGLLIPAINSQLGARNLESAGHVLSDQLSLARQEAISRNRSVEFRIYRFLDQQEPGSEAEMRGFQLFAIEGDGSKLPVSKVVYLPTGTLISEKPEMTSMVSLVEKNPVSGDPPLPRATGPFTYRSFEFRPDGSTDLAYGSKHFFTVRERKDDQNPPKNYFTILIESTTGRTQVYRP